jgi:hypothetical protein
MRTLLKNMNALSWVLFISIITSCGEDYTIEDKNVSGNFVYVTKEFKPTAFDTQTQAPIAATITMDGTGTLTDLGAISILSSFNYDFITGKGTNFVTNYTGATSADSFTSEGTSQRQADGSILVTETLSNGKGKFSKISGSGETKVIIKQDNSGGTGVVQWKVTF